MKNILIKLLWIWNSSFRSDASHSAAPLALAARKLFWWRTSIYWVFWFSQIWEFFLLAKAERFSRIEDFKLVQKNRKLVEFHNFQVKINHLVESKSQSTPVRMDFKRGKLVSYKLQLTHPEFEHGDSPLETLSSGFPIRLWESSLSLSLAVT